MERGCKCNSNLLQANLDLRHSMLRLDATTKKDAKKNSSNTKNLA
jgi:hypothetical protein